MTGHDTVTVSITYSKDLFIMVTALWIEVITVNTFYLEDRENDIC